VKRKSSIKADRQIREEVIRGRVVTNGGLSSMKASATSKEKTLRLTCPFWRLVAGLMAVAYNTLRFAVLGA